MDDFAWTIDDFSFDDEKFIYKTFVFDETIFTFAARF